MSRRYNIVGRANLKALGFSSDTSSDSEVEEPRSPAAGRSSLSPYETWNQQAHQSSLSDRATAWSPPQDGGGAPKQSFIGTIPSDDIPNRHQSYISMPGNLLDHDRLPTPQTASGDSPFQIGHHRETFAPPSAAYPSPSSSRHQNNVVRNWSEDRYINPTSTSVPDPTPLQAPTRLGLVQTPASPNKIPGISDETPGDCLQGLAGASETIMARMGFTNPHFLRGFRGAGHMANVPPVPRQVPSGKMIGMHNSHSLISGDGAVSPQALMLNAGSNASRGRYGTTATGAETLVSGSVVRLPTSRRVPSKSERLARTNYNFTLFMDGQIDDMRSLEPSTRHPTSLGQSLNKVGGVPLTANPRAHLATETTGLSTISARGDCREGGYRQGPAEGPGSAHDQGRSSNVARGPVYIRSGLRKASLLPLRGQDAASSAPVHGSRQEQASQIYGSGCVPNLQSRHNGGQSSPNHQVPPESDPDNIPPAKKARRDTTGDMSMADQAAAASCLGPALNKKKEYDLREQERREIEKGQRYAEEAAVSVAEQSQQHSFRICDTEDGDSNSNSYNPPPFLENLWNFDRLFDHLVLEGRMSANEAEQKKALMKRDLSGETMSAMDRLQATNEELQRDQLEREKSSRGIRAARREANAASRQDNQGGYAAEDEDSGSEYEYDA